MFHYRNKQRETISFFDEIISVDSPLGKGTRHHTEDALVRRPVLILNHTWEVVVN